MPNEKAIEMFVGGLVLDPGTQAPIVLLKTENGDTCLPIWIGIAEATSIATVLKDLSLARPMTHDLMHTAFEKLGLSVQRVMITDLRDATYYAELVLGHGDNLHILDCRPSDAIALALRSAAPIFVNEKVLKEAKVAMGEGMMPSEEQTSSETDDGSSVEDAMAEKASSEKDFNLVDKDKWSEILDELDPDDFKYKM